MKILKFGGSSVSTPERIEGVVRILKGYHERGDRFSVVFSAFGGVTDFLIEMSHKAAQGDAGYLHLFETFRRRHNDAAQALLSSERQAKVLPVLEQHHEQLKNLLQGISLVMEASARTMDYVLSFGERNAAFIIAHALDQAGIPARFLDAREIIKTDRNFGNAKVDFELTNPLIREYYSRYPGELLVVTGFISAAKGGLTTTLGRGGSDYTAAILAGALDAAVIEIWTDVDGVLTADPRKVRKAFTIPIMTYAEAMEMSHFGAKVIYPPTLQPALVKNIPLYIKNTFNPSFPGTYISNEQHPEGHAVQGISSISHVTLLTLQGSGLFGVPGIAGRLFNALANGGINVMLITQGSSESSISFAIQPQVAKKAKKLVDKAFEYEIHSGIIDPVKMEDDLAVVAIVGENMRYRPGISGRLFHALGTNGINVVAIAQGSSELNISVVIHHADETKALNAIHEAFFLSDTKELHLFIVGTGLIGSTLLKQIQKQAAYLREKRSLELRVVGLANSRKMVFRESGIDLSHWNEALAESPDTMSMPAFVEKMKALNLSNAIFVDNTASEAVARHYERILDASIAISTPNKIATSSLYDQYERLKRVAEKRGVKFLYETNVGAGLPVITTLSDLLISGDRIIRIEGVLSGSLSFIFNSFQEGRRFSEILQEAKKRGLTEPDPRIDLNGVDVRRKIIILARESGWPLEVDDVEVTSFLPESCQKAESVADFYTAVEAADDYFEQLRRRAADAGQQLRMIARLENGKASIGLQAVDNQHPFYTLSGSDNMIVFTTERYTDRPLVIRGPGAGAEVTAAGVFAEIISIGNYIG